MHTADIGPVKLNGQRDIAHQTIILEAGFHDNLELTINTPKTCAVITLNLSKKSTDKCEHIACSVDSYDLLGRLVYSFALEETVTFTTKALYISPLGGIPTASFFGWSLTPSPIEIRAIPPTTGEFALTTTVNAKLLGQSQLEEFTFYLGLVVDVEQYTECSVLTGTDADSAITHPTLIPTIEHPAPYTSPTVGKP